MKLRATAIIPPRKGRKPGKPDTAEAIVATTSCAPIATPLPGPLATMERL